jgi:hypothetical protein
VWASPMLYLLDVAHEGLGHDGEARLAYEEAVREAEAVGSYCSLWPILARLAPLEAAAGAQTQADIHAAKACEIVEHIARNTGSDVLAESFRATPEVRALLGA